MDGFHCPRTGAPAGSIPGSNINTTPTWRWLGLGRSGFTSIVTHEEVYFYVDDQRVIMRPGELWYCDFTHPHRVHNKSSIGRVHMVLDLKVNDWLREFFPPEPLGDKVKNAVQRARYFSGYYARQAAAHPMLAPVKKRSTGPRRIASRGHGVCAPPW